MGILRAPAFLSGWLSWIVTATIVILTLVAQFTFDVHQDEGYYYNTIHLIASGYAPYHDFATSQNPLAYYAHLPAYFLTGGTFLGMRLFSSLFGLAAIGLTVDAMRRLKGGHMAIVVAILIGCNVSDLYTYSILKSYSTVALLWAAAFWLFAALKADIWRYPLMAAVIALLPATRLSLVAAPILFLLALAITHYRQPRLVLSAIAASIGATLLVIGPSLRYPREFFANVVTYHLRFDALSEPAGGRSLIQIGIHLMEYYGKLFRDHTLLSGLALACFVLSAGDLWTRRREIVSLVRRYWLVVATTLIVIVTHLLHVTKSRSFPEYDVVLIIPVAIMVTCFIAWYLRTHIGPHGESRVLIPMLCIAWAANVFGISGNLYLLNSRPGILSRMADAEIVRQTIPAGAPVYQLSGITSALTNRPGVPESSMGIFAVLPTATDEDFVTYRLANQNQLFDQLLSLDIDYAVLTPFEKLMPDMTPDQRAQFDATFERVGAFRSIYGVWNIVYRRRPAVAAGDHEAPPLTP